MSELQAVDKEQAMRDNKGKLRVSLVPPEAIRLLAGIYQAGTRRYPDNNWRKGQPVTQSLDSLLRHLLEFMDHTKSDLDDGPKGTKQQHIVQVAWNALTIAIDMEAHPELDDRYKG